MKYISLSMLTLLSSINYLVAMNSQERTLTEAETKCFNWFNNTHKQLSPSPFQKLSQDDRAVYTKGIRYTDDPEAVIQSRKNFAAAFYTMAKEANIPLEYDQDTLTRTFIKMAKILHQNSIENPTTLLETRMWAFSKKLTAEEQATWGEENYLKNPHAAEKNAFKFSTFVAEKLAELKLIDNTETAKEQTIQQIYTDKISDFKKYYKKDE